jgi:hypothetical protein
MNIIFKILEITNMAMVKKSEVLSDKFKVDEISNTKLLVQCITKLHNYYFVVLISLIT